MYTSPKILFFTDFMLGLIIPILGTSFDKNNKGTVHDRYLIVCTYFKDISEGEIPWLQLLLYIKRKNEKQ